MLNMPVSLMDIALSAFGEFLQELVINLALKILPDSRAIQQTNVLHRVLQIFKKHKANYLEFETRYLEPACRYLENAIESNCPPYLVNEINKKLFTYLYFARDQISWKKKFFAACKKNRYYVYGWSNVQKEIISEIAKSITHSCVSKLVFCEEDYFWDKCRDDVFRPSHLNKILLKLRKVEVLNMSGFSGHELSDKLYVMLENLQEFIFIDDCDDAVLGTLFKSCQHLRKIDVAHSKNVTDLSIKYILTFSQLKYLKITNTAITSNGVSILMKGFFVYEEQMKLERYARLNLNVFTAHLSQAQLLELPDCLPDITFHEICMSEPCSLMPLTRLKKLRSLKISHQGGSSYRLDQLISKIGGQISNLFIDELRSFDFSQIAQKCTSLENFSWICKTMTGREEVWVPVPDDLEEFPSLKSFTTLIEWENIDIVENLLKKFVNLKILKLKWVCLNSDGTLPAMMKDVFEKLMNGHLQELEVYDTQMKYCEGNVRVLCDNKYYILETYADFETILVKDSIITNH